MSEQMNEQMNDESMSTEPEQISPFHPVNVGHLVMGVAFLGLTVVWALIASDTVEYDEARWLLPLPWLAAGAAGLVVSLVRGGRPRPGRMTGWQQNSPGSPD